MSGNSGFRKLTGKIEDFARDLVSLEVNTIVKENISGGSMPGNHHCLVDISHSFRRKLLEFGADLDNVEVQEQMLQKARDKEGGDLTRAMVRYGFRKKEDFAAFAHGELHGYGGFSFFRKHCVILMEGLQKEVEKNGSTSENRRKAMMLTRLKDMCDQLKGLLTDPEYKYRFPFSRAQVVAMETGHNPDNLPELTPLQFNSQQVSTLRKIWEIQTEVIVMQSIMHLDGDVVNRISPDFLKDDVVSTALFKMHNQGVTTSLSLWKELVDVVKSFFSSFVKA